MTQKAFDEELGGRLAEHRKRLAISQEFLGIMLRRDQTYVSKIETGKRTLSVFEFVRWARAMNLNDAELQELIFKIESNA